VIAVTTSFLGDSEVAIRLPAPILATVGLWLVYELGRMLYGHRTGAWACLIVAASPGTVALCLLMTIDAPFLMAWVAAVYCLWRMFDSKSINPYWVVPAILATGIGLLAKQSAFGLFPLAALFLAMNRSDWARWKSPWLWVWVIGSCCFLTPVLFWNYRHDWVTLNHTRDHFAPHVTSLPRHLFLFAEFVASQFAILSPVVCCQVLTLTGMFLVSFHRLQRRERFLLCFGGIPLIAVIGLSLVQHVQPNWAVALHLTGVILLAAWGCGQISMSPWINGFRSWIPTGVALGAGLSIMMALVPFVISSTNMAGTSVDPTIRMRGWSELGRQVGERLQHIENGEDLLVIAATSRGPVSELAYYLPGRPRVYRWNVGGIVDSQHDVWGGPTDRLGRDALIIVDDVSPLPVALADNFHSHRDLGVLTVTLGPAKIRQYRLWHAVRLQSWPEQVTRSSIEQFPRVADRSRHSSKSRVP
jgi:4-amino-4-deoxy-L-arabinose transferase-like glycosyltransferase